MVDAGLARFLCAFLRGFAVQECSQILEAAESCRIELGYAIHRRTRSPARSTTTGIQK